MGRWLSRQPDPIFGYDLKKLLQKGGVQLKPRTEAIEAHVISFADNTTIRVKNVVWATGFYPDYRWIEIPDVHDDKGKPIHQRGISPVSGLYFVGTPWQHSRGSALIGGIGRDAEFVVNSIK
ncbi:hypothetical protein CGZ75_07520 [Paenibacillus herberti]|uniref:Uncharacterized protein n=1 Tax=Paenibacillus herberti TaxID=1619309 RepID=A0A229P2M6_9BACL|nr:hypothetical protein CGZ75_07520 [Paenibacillus herberti]